MKRTQTLIALLLSALMLLSLCACGGKDGTVGIGLSSQRTEMYTEFTKVLKIKAYPRRDLIKVNKRLGHNQVYAAKEDYEFVKNYIVAHCPNIKQ